MTNLMISRLDTEWSRGSSIVDTASSRFAMYLSLHDRISDNHFSLYLNTGAIDLNPCL